MKRSHQTSKLLAEMNYDQTAKPIGRLGELLLATPMLFAGCLHFLHGPGVAKIVPPWMPWRLFWAYLTGSALIAAGISIALRRQTRLAATLLGVMLLIFVLLIHLPSMINSVFDNPDDVKVLWSFNGTGGVNNAVKDIGLAASALILGGAQLSRTQKPQKFAAVCTITFAVIMALYGIEHFFYTSYTPGVPSWSLVTFWIPWRMFWGYVSGVILLAAGVCVLAKRNFGGAATCLGFVILGFAIGTYALRVMAHQGQIGELVNTAKDIGLAGGAFILAGSMAKKGRVDSQVVQQRGALLPSPEKQVTVAHSQP
jgi:uncharacterized membrane protein